MSERVESLVEQLLQRLDQQMARNDQLVNHLMQMNQALLNALVQDDDGLDDPVPAVDLAGRPL
ncbi:hypothetical protein A6D6_02682 [Alcanivorax xiamenensis]|uniref:SlyX protein n=1 Tax=Alcanivorax xiamenensis TaxID=1177156 RepID=A0ABQ6Y6D0_9GAMM|nr:hypothetical protein [Alcanivorax xiamenensis]KAF0804918.1 hypothetical protein A6D6_02682 [Alcanivorax xiamenensis]